MNIYEIGSMAEKLANNTYPGRGIVLGQTPDGKKSVAAYFIMGRSVNSRNRVFLEESDGIRTEAYDPSLLADPSLIIYHPVREAARALIVTNGDQTDTIREYLEKGQTFETACSTREFEPDGPNWTPRISGLLSPDGSYKMSILKAADANHIRALLDLLYEGNFSVAQGMKEDFICTEEYDEEIFDKVLMLKSFQSWDSINDFMRKEYKDEWGNYLIKHS